MDRAMNICGVLVHVRRGDSDAVARALAGVPGLEIHGCSAGGRLIVTVEDTADSSAADTLAAIHRTDGVIAAALVYHHCEPAGAGPLSEEN